MQFLRFFGESHTGLTGKNAIRPGKSVICLGNRGKYTGKQRGIFAFRNYTGTHLFPVLYHIYFVLRDQLICR